MNSQRVKAADDKTQKISPLSVYTATISVVGLVLLFWSLRRLPSSLPNVLLFLGLIIFAELINIEGFAPQISFSISSATCFATLLLFGPLPGSLGGAVGGGVATLVREIGDRRRGRPRAPMWQRLFFNMAALSLAFFIAGELYVILGGKVGELELLSNVLPMLLVAIANEFVNAAVIVGAVSLQTGVPVLHIWKRNFSWAIPINILGMVIGGGGLALGYQIAGLLGAIVFFLPIALIIYAFRLYVQQTKAQMDRLEELVAERTDDLTQANEELKRQDRVKSGFFSLVNHEMRSPLTAILGYSDIMLFSESLSFKQRDMLETIKENSQRLLDLVNNILDVSRLEDGRLNIVPQAMNIQAAVEQAQSVVTPMARAKHIAIGVDIPPTIPHVQGDPQRVVQILINLLSNAVKYTPEAGCIAVSGRLHDPANAVEISVIDNGIGIPADQLPHVFDRFSRIERTEILNIVGTGLGLSIAKGLVEAHGGQIWVESKEGRGTAFTFTLPIFQRSFGKTAGHRQFITRREEPAAN